MNDVSLLEMMNAREMRCRLQQQLLQLYKKTLICLTLNIPGPVKVLPGVPEAWETACRRIETILKEHLLSVEHLETIKEKTGYEAFYSIDASPESIKELMMTLEDRDRLGRLFDIDVLRTDGTKVSREELGYPARRCLLCDEPAHACSRSRRHSVEELIQEINRILGEQTAKEQPLSVRSRFYELCGYSLMAEVSATPKPGLVDRHDSGAHKDMCFETFQASSAAIAPYITRMFELGLIWQNSDGDGLFAAIRPVGIEAEKAMFTATCGVNTHKGMIFSMGLIAAAAGLSFRRHSRFCPEDILSLAGHLCRDTLEQDFGRIDSANPRTHGEILYVRYGIKGIRGEAQEGFPSIRDISLPALRFNKNACADDNQAYLNTLLALMSQVDDTNVLIRTSHALLNYEKAEAARILAMGGAAEPQGIAELRLVNENFIRLNISPGGCADLLAVTILLWHLEQIQGGYHETEI